MLKMALAGLAMSVAVVSVAAPAPKESKTAVSDPVAEGFADWQGVCRSNYISGREITPSDLRHKVVVVIDLEPNAKLQEHFTYGATYAMKTGLLQGTLDLGGQTWETAQLPRHTIVVFSIHGQPGKARQAAMEALSVKDPANNRSLYGLIAMVLRNGTAIYENVTLAGGPETAGKRPFVYVLGHDGKEPIAQGELTAASAPMRPIYNRLNEAAEAVKNLNPPWRPFYGTIAEPKYHPQLAKILQKGGALDALARNVILKNVRDENPEKAKEAQILFDAINQTRADLEYTVSLTMNDCPHRAYYDANQILKYWPKEKKRLEPMLAKIRTSPNVDLLAKVYANIVAWSSPDFECKNERESKKIVAELGKMKKSIAKLKESPVVVVQDGATRMDVAIDELLSTIPTRIAGK